MSQRALGLVLFACTFTQIPQVIQGTTGARSASLELHAGGLVARQGEAGATFGTLQAGKAKRQVNYFLLFKHRLSPTMPAEVSEETTADGDTGSSKQSVAIDDKSLQLEYQVQLDATTKKVTRETLTLNKKPVDLSRGRVLLVDLTVNPPRWEQRKIDLLAEVGETTSKKDAEELIRKVIASAETNDRKIKEFVEAARK